MTKEEGRRVAPCGFANRLIGETHAVSIRYMGRLLPHLFAAVVLAAVCNAQSPKSEEEYAKAVRQREATFNSVLKLAIPRIVWNGLSCEEAWRSLEKSIRDADPAGQGVKLVIGQGGDVKPDEQDANESRVVAIHARFLGGTWKAPLPAHVFANAREVTGIEAIKHLANLYGLRFKVFGDGWSPGVYFWNGRHSSAMDRASLEVSPAVRAMLKSKMLTNVPGFGWMDDALGWKGRLPHDAELDPAVAIQWKNRDSRLVIDGLNGEVFKLRQHMDFLEDAAVAYGLVRLHEGERRLLDAITPLGTIKLQRLNIDAPTLGEALEKLRLACRAVPGTREASLRWPFLKPNLGTLGPVSFRLENGNAADVLFPILFKLGCKLGSHRDGRWGITTRQMSDGDYIETRQFSVPPSFFPQPTQTSKPRLRANNTTAAGDPLACVNAFTPRVNGSIAIYSRTSNTLIVKETAEGFLMIRKAFSECWPKAGLSPVTKE